MVAIETSLNRLKKDYAGSYHQHNPLLISFYLFVFVRMLQTF